MSDDLNKKIRQITDILSQENLPENLKGLLSLLTSSGNGDSPAKSSEPPALKEERTEKSDLEENVDTLRKMKKVLDKMNNVNDPRVNLLMSIKPFLNARRQKKLLNCVSMIRFSNASRMLEENEK